MFYTAYEGLSAGIMSANPPYGYTYTSAAPPLFASPFTVAATGANAGQRFPLQQVAYGASLRNPNSTVNWSQFEPLVGIPAVDPRDVTPYAEHWMASVERQFGARTLATVSYVGAAVASSAGAGRGQSRRSRALPEPGLAPAGRSTSRPRAPQFGPAFGSVELQRTIANAGYNALEATLNHRAARAGSAGQLHLVEIHRSIRRIARAGESRESLAQPRRSRPSTCATTWSPASTTSCPRSREGPAPCNRIRLGRWPASRASPPGLPVTLLNNNDTSLLGTIPNGINNNGVDTPDWSGTIARVSTGIRAAARRSSMPAQLTLPALGTMGNARRRFFSGPGHGESGRHALAHDSSEG